MSTVKPAETTTHVLVEAVQSSKVPNLTAATVPVLVGTKTFHIHTSVLSTGSKFFINAMKPEWRKDPSKPIDLSAEDPAVFETYAQYLYTHKVVFKGSAGNSFNHVAALYVLGGFLKDASFQNFITGALIRHCNATQRFPPETAVEIIYQGTTSGSPFRRLLVDIWAYAASSGWIASRGLVASTSVDFVEDVVKALLEVREKPAGSRPRPWVAEPKSYNVSMP